MRAVVKPTFYEFFSGGGMARAGLGEQWQCLFANDFDAKKVAAYSANWGTREILHKDVHELETKEMPGAPDLAWASFPCQDLSLAGNGAGLAGARSGAFWGFERALRLLKADGRAPDLLVLENVAGMLTSNRGMDFAHVCRAIDLLGYDFGALVMDAVHFVPQSRPRLFILAARRGARHDTPFSDREPDPVWTSPALRAAHADLPPDLRAHWKWWRLPAPPIRNIDLAAIVEDEPLGVKWHTREETQQFVSRMSPANLRKLEEAKRSGRRVVGTMYRRTRFDENGAKGQRAELRTDGVAGCLRTPGGGSSRQFLLFIDGEKLRSRLISAREAARLMGLPDSYVLPANYNDAYHLVGDGLAVPVVRHLGEFLSRLVHIKEPLLVAAE